MRTGRQRSNADIYHVVQRGSGGQLIFEQDADRREYLDLLVGAILESEESIEILAWCLMSNHVHLLVRANLPALSFMMKRVATSYAMHFNRRYGRTGHLFQDRFWSEPVNDDGYLLQVVRYIHFNPLKAGAKSCGAYRWSSYCEYAEGKSGIANTDFVLGIMGGRNAFVRFHSLQGDPILNHSLDFGGKRISDDDVARIARAVLGEVSPYDLRGLPKGQRDAGLLRLREAGLSFRQIARVTGIGKSTVGEALKAFD